MKTKNIKDIISDLRTAASDESRDFASLSDNAKKQAAELEAILAKEKAEDRFALIVLALSFLFIGGYALITSLYNDDLRDDVSQKKEIITKYEEAVKHDTVITYRDHDGTEITVQSLLDDNLKLMDRIADLEYKASVYEIYLKNIENRYGIKVIEENNTIRLDAKKVDSALILLPVYRDKVSYDSIKGHWSVSRRSIKVGDETYTE
jgi:hypothetical protein